LGGAGHDHVLANDGQADTINCGSGRDHVTADAIDSVHRSCERIDRV
jgi:hypothetical protein